METPVEVPAALVPERGWRAATAPLVIADHCDAKPRDGELLEPVASACLKRGSRSQVACGLNTLPRQRAARGLAPD